MRRAALYGIGWLVAAVLAVLIAWQGVGRVGRSVTEAHPRALSADEARQALGNGPAPVDPSATGPTAPAPPPGDGSPAPPGATTTTTRLRTTATTRSTTSPPASSPTPPATTSPPAPAATTTTTAGGVVRTYNLVGGSATVRFESSGRVTVVWANPNPGYRAEVDNRSDGGVRIRFESSSHRSQLEAWWDGGPQDRIEEDGSGGGGGSGPG